MDRRIAVIICAAGASSRFGGKRKKIFADVDGKAAFLRSVELFTDRKDVKQIVVAIAREDDEAVRLKWGANLQFFGAKICYGGKERFETVKNALEHVKPDINLIVVHDAARCCVRAEWIDKCFDAAEKDGAAILACPVVATLKKVKNGKIVQTVDRSGLFEAQTPQVFKTKLLKDAYGNLGKLGNTLISDDAQLIEAMGRTVTIVETDSSNIKITTQSDVPMAEAVIKANKPKPTSPLGPFFEAQW